MIDEIAQLRKTLETHFSYSDNPIASQEKRNAFKAFRETQKDEDWEDWQVS